MARSRSTTRRHWLFKSEPEVYGVDRFVADGQTHWDGIRNYQARNMLRDDVQVGDGVLFYHSNAKPLAVVGVAKVVRAGYPDHTAWDPQSKYHDPKSDPEDPTWFMVDIECVERFAQPVTRDALMAESDLAEMMLLQRGSRLSIQPVSAKEWRRVLQLAGSKANW